MPCQQAGSALYSVPFSCIMVVQDNVAAAAGEAKDKTGAKLEKNKAEAQTSAYNTRSKAANKLNPDK